MFKTTVVWGPTWVFEKKKRVFTIVFETIPDFHETWKNAYAEGKKYTEKKMSRKTISFFSIFFLEKRYGRKLSFREETKWKQLLISKCATFYFAKFRFFPLEKSSGD